MLAPFLGASALSLDEELRPAHAPSNYHGQPLVIPALSQMHYRLRVEEKRFAEDCFAYTDTDGRPWSGVTTKRGSDPCSANRRLIPRQFAIRTIFSASSATRSFVLHASALASDRSLAELTNARFATGSRERNSLEVRYSTSCIGRSVACSRVGPQKRVLCLGASACGEPPPLQFATASLPVRRHTSDRSSNKQMEPTRLPSGATLSPRRAAHLQR